MLKIFLSSHGKFASGIQSSCGILLGPSDNLKIGRASCRERVS